VERLPHARSCHEIPFILTGPVHVQGARAVRVVRMSGKADLSNPLGAAMCPASRMTAGPQAHRVDARASSKSGEPTTAMAVNEPGLGSSADGKGKKGIYGSLERTGTLLYLGE